MKNLEVNKFYYMPHTGIIPITPSISTENNPLSMMNITNQEVITTDRPITAQSIRGENTISARKSSALKHERKLSIKNLKKGKRLIKI